MLLPNPNISEYIGGGGGLAVGICVYYTALATCGGRVLQAQGPDICLHGVVQRSAAHITRCSSYMYMIIVRDAEDFAATFLGCKPTFAAGWGGCVCNRHLARAIVFVARETAGPALARSTIAVTGERSSMYPKSPIHKG